MSFVRLLSGNAVGSALLFVRNVLVARLIGIEDYGIATTFAMVVSVVEMTSQIGLQQLIVQANDGDDEAFQANMQGIHLFRCTANALLLIILAHPFAEFMGIPQVAWAFQVLAVPRLAMGFIHFDIYRRQRHMIYWPMLWSNNLSYLGAVLAVFPLVWWTGDFRVMLFSIVTQGMINTVVSHMVSERRYRLRIDMAFVVRAFGFGWPLLLNGAVMFLVFNGEKIIVGREVGMAVLAFFAMGMTLTFSPAQIISRTVEGFFFPQVAAGKDDYDRFSHLVLAGAQISLISGILLILLTVVITKPLIPLLLGADYAELVPLMFWFALLQAVRSAKGGLMLASLAKARTRNVLYTNGCRVASLPLSWYAATQGLDVRAILMIAIGGECFGFLLSQYLLRRQFRLSLRPLIPGYLGYIGFIATMLVLSEWTADATLTPVPYYVEMLLPIGIAALAIATMTRFWAYIRSRNFTSY